MLNWLKGIFFKVCNALGGFFKQVFTSATQIILVQLKDIAINAVSELEKTGLTNEEKRKEAFKKISDYATLKGLDVKASLINLVIEMALQVIKNKIEG